MMTCTLDWQHELVSVAVAPRGRGVQLTLRHGSEEVVLTISPASLDALTWACLRIPRPEREGGHGR